MRSHRLLIIAILLGMWIAPLSAAPLTIQIGAYAKPEFAETSRAQEIGDIARQLGNDGLTRIYIGRFAALPDAEAALIRLQAAGYHDAFISSGSTQATHNQTSLIASHLATGANIDIEQRRYNAAKAKLPPAQHANIVVLDGRLMLRDGDNFRPID